MSQLIQTVKSIDITSRNSGCLLGVMKLRFTLNNHMMTRLMNCLNMELMRDRRKIMLDRLAMLEHLIKT